MSSNRGVRKLWRLSMVGALAFGASCQNTDKATATTSASASPNSTAGEPPKPEPAPLDRIDEANFQLTWTLVRTDGKSGAGELVLTAKSPFKPNQDYPHKFKLKGSDVTPTKAEVTKEDVQVSPERVVVPVSFEITGPNPALGGTLAFSVCTAEACLIERKDIRLSVTDVAKNNAPAVGGTPTATTASANVKSTK